MNLQQLRYLCAVVDHGLNLSKAAESLHTSQPGISKQIRLLEEEIGAVLLVREGNRVSGLTEPGRRVLEIALRVLRDIHNVRSVGADFRGEDSGTLTIATTHVHARYILLPVVKQFRRSFPNVRLVLDQGNPNEVVGLVNEGRADIGLCSAPTKPVGRAVELPCFRVPRAVVVPAEHPLLRAERRVSIADLAAYPFIMLDPSFSGGVSVQAAFRENGIEPNVVLTATDADVVKAYVEAGCGIATLPEIAFDPRRDEALRLIDARHLFVPSLSSLWIEKGRYLRRFAFDFIQMVSPVWTPTLVDRQLTSAEPLDVGMAIEVGSTSLPYGS